ncbi:MAG TPA: TM2 domain-containing protein [Acidimicrobiales bacterium]|nr:TM2 domain-containing protein [Acidimicrobiales bacterium]
MSNVPPPPPPSGGQGPQGPSSAPGAPPSSGGYSAPGGPSPAPLGGAADSGGILSPRWMVTTGPPAGWEPKQKMVAGILGILLGSIGVHSFYLGNAKKGIIQIVAMVLTCGILGIWGFIEGIMILIGNIKTDAYGVPLTE